ncbi:MAG: helix-turn-helix domain-containing protein [Desulfurococcales archaeon]|nr:helix-turn-helix domain-containing protein [Desulfurococcales archaeon]MCE4604990.1 helix-turn-helix domain-containing protein [Desulfurococcales archaeon]
MVEYDMKSYVIEAIARRISGDIVFSDEPGSALRKWREYFGVSQHEIARVMGISSSVISDYEKGRRNPGSKFIKRFVLSLIELDSRRGYEKVSVLSRTLNVPLESVLDMSEFDRGVTVSELADLVQGTVLTTELHTDRVVYGYTVVDSLKAIASLSGIQFYALFGTTPERAIIFTGVRAGRSPMVAVRVSPVKPSVVVIHGPRRHIDPLAIELARLDGVPLILSFARSVDEMIRRLRSRSVHPSPYPPVA